MSGTTTKYDHAQESIYVIFAKLAPIITHASWAFLYLNTLIIFKPCTWKLYSLQRYVIILSLFLSSSYRYFIFIVITVCRYSAGY